MVVEEQRHGGEEYISHSHFVWLVFKFTWMFDLCCAQQ